MRRGVLENRQAESVAAGLVHALEDEILGSRLKPGDRLDEQALAKRFSVSRTPVREALRHLASSGLIEIRRNQGATVRTLTTTELIEMFQVMAELEGLCARLCARRMTDLELAAMRSQNELCDARARAGDHDGFFEANNIFHDTIYAGSQNVYLHSEARKLRNRINVYRRHITFQPRRMTRTVAEHWKIVEAIEAGEAEAAHKFMREHVDL
ncbi:MAG TPA: GntR family transcriptional regulator, partial [Aestuariivirgaceae bacterium]|nr:GntR family transcriptional regulator [Aestuariivirgaceae bacterium]